MNTSTNLKQQILAAKRVHDEAVAWLLVSISKRVSAVLLREPAKPARCAGNAWHAAELAAFLKR